MSFLTPLVDAMTQQDPSARPTAEGARKMFNDIMKRKFKVLLRRRLTPEEPHWIGNTYRAITTITDEITFQINCILRTIVCHCLKYSLC